MESKLFAYLPPPPHPDSAGLKAILNLRVVLHMTCIDGKHCERGQYHLYTSCYTRNIGKTHSVECNLEPSDIHLTTVDCIGCLVVINCDNLKPRKIPLESDDILGYICLLVNSASSCSAIVSVCCAPVSASSIFILDDDFDGGE